MPECPDCGDPVARDQNFCRGCGTDLSDVAFPPEDEGSGEESFRDRVESIREERAASGESDEHAAHLDCEPQGEWVTGKRVAKVADLLDADETVHYMWRGGTIDVEGSGAGDSIWGNDRDRKSSLKGIFTAVTNERVVIAIP